MSEPSAPLAPPGTAAATGAEAKSILGAVLDGLDSPIFSLDREYRYTSFNAAHAQVMRQLYGVDIELGKRLADYQAPADWEIARKNLDRALAGASFVESAFSGIEGRARHSFEVTHHPIRSSGQIIGAAVIARDTTERQRAAEALRESQGEQRELLEKLPVGLVTHGLDSAVLFANPRAVALLGLSQEAMAARRANDAAWYFVRGDGTRMPPEEYPVSRALASEDGRVEQLELGICRSDRESPIWVQCDAYPLRGPDGEIQRIAVAFFDITERKQAQLKLEHREALHVSVLGALSEGLVLQDLEDKVILANQKAADLLGLTIDQLMGKSSFDPGWSARREDGTPLRPEEHPSVVTCRTGVPVDHFTMVVKSGGALDRTLSINSRAVTDPRGRRTGAVTTFRDMSAQRHSEKALTRLAMLVEQASDTICVTDLGGAIVYVNAAFERTTGYTRAEALGQNPRLVKSGQQDAAFYRQLWATLERGEVWRGNFLNRRKDGTLYEEEATISPVRDPHGTVINYAAVKRDVTREKQLERQFLQAQKMEGIGQLAGGVAHDFNNILAAIMMESERGSDDTQTLEMLRESMGEILVAAQRAAKLTRQLLLFSRREVVRPTLVDLNDLVLNLSKMLQRLLREDVSFELHLHSGTLMTHADAGMLDQLIMNLVVNARDAMPHGGRLVIETGARVVEASELPGDPEVSAGRHVWLSVTDTGVGIAPEHLPRIFEPFFSTKEVGQGTGLGLATVSGIVKLHHGWLEVDSVVGKGTTMQAFLPAREEITAPVSEPSRTPPRGGSETLLVVEDDPVVRRLTRRTLEAGGYHVLEAEDGVAAMTVWQEHQSQIALVITDFVMPGGVGGSELAARLREVRPGLKIVFISGYSGDIAGLELKLDPGQAFMQKPFATHDLLEQVRALLDS